MIALCVSIGVLCYAPGRGDHNTIGTQPTPVRCNAEHARRCPHMGRQVVSGKGGVRVQSSGDNGTVLVLASGGIDSTACLSFFLGRGSRVNALFLDYGQPAVSQEEQAVTAICAHYDVPLAKVTCSGLGEIAGGLVVGRNAFLLYAALMAIGVRPGMVGIGIHHGTTYPDCTEQFLHIMQSSFDLYTDGRVIINAPFLDWSKPMIWDYCKTTNVPLHLTYSCELGREQPCGECLSCRDLEALYAGED